MKGLLAQRRRCFTQSILGSRTFGKVISGVQKCTQSLARSSETSVIRLQTNSH